MARPSSRFPKQPARHTGFHASMGIAIDENNKVVELTKGTALTDGAICTGDIVLSATLKIEP